jgi:hypothetical protein
MVVNGSGGGDGFVVTATPAITVHLNGGSGTNTLTGPNATNTWNIRFPNQGQLNTEVVFSGVQNLIGGTGLDIFKLFSPALTGRPIRVGEVASINGGGAPLGQGDWLDYSNWKASAVTVNLVTGSATAVGSGAVGAISNIKNVVGGPGNDTLTGQGGNIFIGGAAINTLTDTYAGSAASGRSLLIGGTGSSNLTAGSAGDILIAGTTRYDSNYAALMSILAEWQSNDSYATRFHDINTGTGGGLNGTYKLSWGKTVKDSDAASVLTGGTAGLDWFFANYPNGNDTIYNFDLPGDEYINNRI